MTTPANSRETELKLQLLGLAFAGADLLLEFDADGKVIFALGAVEQILNLRMTEVVGTHWREFICGDSEVFFTILLSEVPVGARQGPFHITLKPSGADSIPLRGMISLIRLPQREDRISCAFTLGSFAPAGSQPAVAGLVDAETFAKVGAVLVEEAMQERAPLQLALVDLPGLGRSLNTMSSESAARVRGRIGAAFHLQSHRGSGAAEVAPDKFAILQRSTAPSAALVEQLSQTEGVQLSPAFTSLALNPQGGSHNIKAMRVALDRYIAADAKSAKATFADTLHKLAHEAAALEEVISHRQFRLVYQPVVSLAGNTLHHFEALCRFQDDSSPLDTIRLVEELNLSVAFDLAVVGKVARVLAKFPRAKIAANISAKSLLVPGFPERLVLESDFDRSVRTRLLLEVTETHEIGDFVMAKDALSHLREAGHRICLDDFGAGAASLEYLRHLDFDFIKIDGRYVQSLDRCARDGVILKHIVGLARELGFSIIGEMVENQATADIIKSLGVTHGQGWHFAKPLAEPDWKPSSTEYVSGRRKGAVEQWG